ncbi:acyl-CoA dehydrogenase family protein [Williamsia soli]|uniref:acyl-CoA dehydrogenase family protein n=1 Tax=Williamsia soli TaxID=364929 RepID=UPI001AA0044B|nr:acyl-CoA dehydrogenase family protein [Williamsia soli]
MQSDLFEADHEAYRETVRGFVDREVVPNLERWDEQRLIDRDTWRAAGKLGLLGLSIPEQFGGADEQDYRFRVVVIEELARVGAASLQSGFSTNDDIVLNYLLRLADEEQRARWLPGFASGESIGAIAMSEPGTGSDLRGITTSAIKRDDGWLLNGTKTFITSGILADLVIVVARTDPDAGSRGFTLLVVEEGMEGFSRGRQLDKVGLAAQDTAELIFSDVWVPARNVLGQVGGGFGHLMDSLPLERLGIGLAAQMSAEAVLQWTVDYVSERSAFGKKISQFQNTGFVLADLATRIDLSRAFLDRAVRQHNRGELSVVDAAKAKLAATELQWDVIDTGVQLHGGYGYMKEYPVAKAFVDARIQRIYGGTNEIMKEIIQRDLFAAAGGV